MDPLKLQITKINHAIVLNSNLISWNINCIKEELGQFSYPTISLIKILGYLYFIKRIFLFSETYKVITYLKRLQKNKLKKYLFSSLSYLSTAIKNK